MKLKGYLNEDVIKFPTKSRTVEIDSEKLRKLMNQLKTLKKDREDMIKIIKRVLKSKPVFSIPDAKEIDKMLNKLMRSKGVK